MHASRDERTRPGSGGSPPMWTLAVFVAGMALTSLLAWMAWRTEVLRLTREIEAETASLAATVEEQAELRILAVERMAERWEMRGHMTREEWETDARLYLEHMNGFVALAWVSQSLELRWLQRLPDVEAFEVAPAAADVRAVAARSAAAQDITVVSDLFALVSHGEGVACFTPVVVDGQVEGLLEGLFAVDHVLATFATAEQLAVTVSAPKPAGTAETETDSRCAVAPVHVRNATWELHACPTDPLLEEAMSPLPAELFGLGTLVSALVAGLVDRAQTARRRSTEAAAASARLAQTVAELRAKQEELEAQQAALRASTAEIEARGQDLSLISYSIAHDLRSPLRTMCAYSRLLLREHAALLDDDGRRRLASIDTSAVRMSRLLDELLSFASVARSGVHRQRLDVTALARAIGAERAEAEPERNVTFVVQDGMEVYADPGLTRTLLEELLDNAWKFSRPREDARVEVAMGEAGGRAWLRVRDNGVGFDPQWAERLFRPFERLHTGEPFEGPGMGLAIVWRIARLHGGDVRIDAREGEGATVCVFFGP